jgi:hypothetical protein
VVAGLNIAAGVVVIGRPEAAAPTMFAALLFLADSPVVRGPQFGWTLVQGAFGLLLGILVPRPALRRPRPRRHRLRRTQARRHGHRAAGGSRETDTP